MADPKGFVLDRRGVANLSYANGQQILSKAQPLTEPTNFALWLSDSVALTVVVEQPGTMRIVLTGRQPLMAHKLGVIPHFNGETAQADLRIAGCLTLSSSIALRPLIRRALSVTGVRAVVVDLTTARHVAVDGLESLQAFVDTINVDGRSNQDDDPIALLSIHKFVQIEMPDELPVCPAYRVCRIPWESPARTHHTSTVANVFA